MEATTISYHQTGFFSNLVLDYLDEKDSLSHLYNHPVSFESVEKIIEEKAGEKTDRAELYRAISNQYQHLPTTASVKQNIKALQNEKTFVVVTAHQLNIFTGPLYVVYKALAAVKLSQQLNEKLPQHHFVPMFWLGSEDHDFDEINHFHLFGKRLTWENPDAKGAVGNLSPTSIRPVLEELKSILGESPEAADLTELFEKAYLQNETVAEAHQFILNHLFGKYGLVVADPSGRDFKKQFIPVMKDELLHKNASKLAAPALEFLNREYHVQAAPRDINLFYLKGSIRERIVFDPRTNHYKVLNTDLHFSENEILDELENYPERFSPNVILRPLFQQKLLPAVAFIGGGGEVAYWLELKAVFDHYKINFPMLVLRNSLLWVDKNAGKKMEKLGVSVADIFKKEDALIKEYVRQNSEQQLDLKDEKKAVAEAFENILTKALQIDPGLKKMVAAEKQNQLNALNRLEGKLLKAEKAKFDTAIGQIKNIKSKLFPGGGLQERHDNFIPFYLKHGEKYFDILLNSLEPLEKHFTVIQE